MNTARLRSKRVILPTIAAVAALGIGGVVWASTASADLQGSERDRVAAAATKAVGGGEVLKVEASDDRNEAYEVEVRKSDGTEVEVSLDKKLTVLGQDTDARDENEGTDTPDADDRVLSSSEQSSAEKAAQDAVGGGTVVDVEAGDDPGTAYEVEVRTSDNTLWNVDLDAGFKVLHKTIER